MTVAGTTGLATMKRALADLKVADKDVRDNPRRKYKKLKVILE